MRYKTKRLIALILVAALSISVLQPTAVAVSVRSSGSSAGLESFVESIPDGVGTVEEKEIHTGDSEAISSEQTIQPQEDDKEKQTSTEKSPSESEDDSDQEGVVQATKTAEVEVADSNEASDTNSCGDQATYTLENGVLTISGTGAIKKEAFKGNSTIKSVIIEAGITEIGNSAFNDCDSLTEVTIPDGVTTIGERAFCSCSGLTKVTLGKKVKTIGSQAFYECSKLTELTINSENIESLGSYVFDYTSSYIATLNVGAEVTTLNSTFYSFSGLKVINVDSGNKAYSSDNGVLYNKDKTELIKYPHKKEDKTFVIPDSVTSIGQYAFYDCNGLAKVTLGTAVKTIGDQAFEYCFKLTELTINSANIESLGSSVFNDTSSYITTLNVGAEVTTLNSTFYSFSGLKVINVDSGNKAYSSDNGVLYNKAQTELIRYPRKMERTSYAVVDGTEKIANSAFYGNAYLLSVSIPDSVVTVGASAFYNCSKLERVTMESGTKEIGTSAFAYCYALSYIRIPETVTQIGSSVFSGSSNVIIYCDVNTVAAQYAANNNIAYVTSTNCITFTISKNCSVQTGNTAVKVPDNINQYRVSLFNQTTGKAITGYRVYASSIVLPMNEISAGDQIKVELVSKKGEAIDYHKVITLDQECKGTADFVVQQKGYISATPVTNTESTVLIYDKEGVLCDTLSTSGKTCTSTFLNAGAYQALLIQGKSYLWNFERLATFQENGLTQGKDYILKQVNVSDGVITTMENIEIPQIDIELLKYLDSAKCSYTANTTEITSGGLLSMRLEYAFKELRKSEVSNVRLQISIPTGCTYVANSLTVDGTLSSKVTESSNSISIPLSDTKGVVRFQVKPIEYGTLSTTATISFTGSKRTMTESVGKINITVPYITLTCNTSTATKKMTVSGLTMPKTKVAIYDGTVRIGTATSNASGKWKAEVELHQATEGSTHRLTAKIKGGTEDEMVSAPVLVQYSPEAVVVKEFLMYYNGGNKMDLTNSAYTAKKVVSFNPAYPFTFTVKLSNNESVDRVYIVSTKGTETKSMKAYWDADTGLWVASGYFDNSNHSYVPGVLTVQFNEKQTSYKVNMEATVEDFQKDPLPDTITDGSCKIDKNSYDENSQTGEISGTYTLADDDHTQIEFQVKNETIEESKKDQYPIDSLENDPDYIELDSNDPSKRHFTKVERDKKGRYIYTTVTYQKEKNSSGEDKWSPSKVATEIIFDLSLDATVDSVSDWIGGPAKTYGKIYGVGKDVIDGLKVCGRTLQIDYLYEAASKKLINMNLPEGEFEKRLEALQKWRTSAYLFCVGRAILVGASLATGLVTGPLGLCLTLSIALVSKLNEYCMEDMVDDLLNSILSYDCRWAVDPSGYVYEGVPSNRLPGVTATIYYKDEKSGQEKLWDASEYEQINPLITDADGSYAWDVPEGLWRVKYEKEGYTTTYSDWVPVPPIQTDINIGMVATAAPKVDQCELYDEYGIVTFSQYMQVSTVNDETITVCTGNGKPVPYSIQPINAEKESEQMLATKFKVQFDKKLSGGLYQVNVSKKVKNYADAALDADYETTITVQKTIEKLTVEVPAVLKNKQTVQIPVIIEPAGDYSDYTLTCSSSETDIAEVVSITQPNDKGVGYVTVTGKLPGSVKLVCKLEGTSIETSVIVAVQGKEEVLVEEKVLSNCTITLGSDTCTYDGKAKAPTVTVKDGTTTLTAGTDYEVVYANNTDVGTAKVTINGKGNYTGTVEKTFQIKAASLSKATVTLAQTSVTYTGAAQTPAAAVTLNGKTLSTADYTVAYQNNTNAGTAKVTVTGKGNYTGTATAAFTIAKAGNTVTASSVNKIVSAKAQSFSIGAKAKGGAKLTYKSNNKSITVDKNGKVTVAKNYIGKATITISAAATTNYNAAVKQIYVTINPTGTKLSSVASAKTGQLTIKWAKNAAVTGYQVQYATSGKFNGAKTLNVKSNKTVTRTLSKLKEKQKYYVRIRTYKTVGKVNYYSAWSAAKSATVKGVTAPAAVKLTSVKSAKAGEMTVKWGKNAKAGGYQLQYATAKNFKSAKTVAVKKAKTTSTTIKKLTKGKKYYVRVRTYQKVSGKTYYSAWSGSKNVTIKK